MFLSVSSEASEPLPGKYVAQRNVQTGTAKSRPSTAVIRIGTIAANRASVSVEIAEPTARQLCGGSISGLARIEGNILTLTKSSSEFSCKLVIKIVDGKASVTSETGCGGFHGVGCSFDTSAVNLVRVKE